MPRGTGIALATICLALAVRLSGAATATLWVFGDSTVKDYANSQDACSTALKISGWGEHIMRFLGPDSLAALDAVIAAESLVLENRANGGRAARTFVDGRDAAILRDAYAKMHPGDYMFIQFGHNDEASCADYPDRCTPIEDFKRYIGMYVDSARARKATPVLITPMVRNAWPEYNTHDNTDGSRKNQQAGNFPLAMQQVAKEKGVPSIDLTQRSIDFFNWAGDDATRYRYFREVRPGASLPSGCSGIDDGTHFQPDGAKAMAGLIYEGLKSLRRVRMDIRDAGKGTVVATSNGVKDKANQNFLQLVNDFRDGDGWYESDFNPTVKIEARPRPGYVFTGWSGDISGTANPAILRMDRNYSIVADFAPINTAIPGPGARALGPEYDARKKVLRVRWGMNGSLRVGILTPDGRRVRSASASSAGGPLEIRLDDATPGSYLLRCEIGGIATTSRLYLE